MPRRTARKTEGTRAASAAIAPVAVRTTSTVGLGAAPTREGAGVLGLVATRAPRSLATPPSEAPRSSAPRLVASLAGETGSCFSGTARVAVRGTGQGALRRRTEERPREVSSVTRKKSQKKPYTPFRTDTPGCVVRSDEGDGAGAEQDRQK